MHIFTLGLLIMSGTSQLEPAIEPIAARAGFVPVYQRHYPGGISSDYVFTNKKTGKTLVLMVGDCRDGRGLKEVSAGLGVGMKGREVPSAPPCGPLGDTCFVQDHRSIKFVGERFFVTAKYAEKAPPEDDAMQFRMLEAVARISLSELIGSDLNADGSQILPQDFSIEHPHWTYKPLSKLADAHSLTVSKGEWGDQCVVTSNGHNLTLTLGSLEAKVDGQAVELPAFPVSKNGAWIVPSTAVLSALGVH